MPVNTWTDQSDNWSTPADWSSGATPGATDDVVVAQGDPELTGNVGKVNSLLVSSSLNIESGGALETAVGVTNSGSLFIDNSGAGGASLTVDGALNNSSFTEIGGGSQTAADTVTAASVVNTGTINLIGGASAPATLDVGSAAGLGEAGIVTGQLELRGHADVSFASGQLTGVASAGFLSIDGTNAFVADAGETTSNSALSGLTSIAGSLSLRDGASIATTGALTSTGSILLGGTSGTATLDIAGTTTQFGSGGALLGQVTLNGNSLLEFASGTFTGIASGGSLSLDGTSAFVADAGATTSNSALTGLADIVGSLSLNDGASITTTGALVNSGSINLDNLGATTTTLTIDSTAGFGTAGIVSGQVELGGNSLLDFSQGGGFTGIAQQGTLSIDGTSAFVASGAATTSNSALANLASNAGTLSLSDGASLSTAGIFSNTGTIDLNAAGGTAESTLSIDSAAGLGQAGVLTGDVSLGGNSLLEFTGGQLSTIAANSQLAINGPGAFVADAGATTSNSALSGLADIVGSLSLGQGASLSTTGAVVDDGTVSLTNFGGSQATTLDIDGTATSFAPGGVVQGGLTVSGDSLLEFTSGEITAIAGASGSSSGGLLSIDGTSAFVADAGATTSNSALSGLASNAGSLSLGDGASIATTGSLVNTGSVALQNSSGASTTTLDIAGTASQFAAGGVLTGSVDVSGNSLLEFTSGSITSIGSESTLTLDGTTAFIADAGATTSNSALTGLASNAGFLSLSDGASVVTNGAFANTGTIGLSSFGGATTLLDVNGSATAFGSAGVLEGNVELSSASLLEFASGQITGIGARSGLSIDGTTAFVADAGATTSSSALTGLASNAGSLTLSDGASLTTAGDLANTGNISLSNFNSGGTTTLDINGSATAFGTGGALTGGVSLSGASLLEFASGSLTSISGSSSSLSIDGTSAFVADAGATTSNGALTGLAANSGDLTLDDGASIATTGAFANTGSISLDNGNDTAPTTTLNINGSATDFATSGVLAGSVSVKTNALLEFASGQISGIGSGSSLSIDGTGAFVADAGATTSNSALTGLADVLGSLSLDDGATITTTGPLTDTGSITLADSSGGQTTTLLDINGVAGFGTAGVVTGSVSVSGNSLIEFGQGGSITSIAAIGTLSLDGSAAFVADAGATTSNSALTTLQSNAGTLSLSDGASLTTPGILTNTGTIDLNIKGDTQTSTLEIQSTAGFGVAGVVTGQVDLGQNTLLEFTGGGQLTQIAASGSLSIDGTNAFVADDGATASNSALSGLADVAGSLSLSDGASIATTGALTNTGTISLSSSSNAAATTTLDIDSTAGFGAAGVVTGAVELSGNAAVAFAQGGEFTSIADQASLSIDGAKAFLADAGATTSNSALTGLVSVAGSLSLADGAAIATTGALNDTGSITLASNGFSGTPSTTTLSIDGSAADLGTAGTLAGSLSLSGSSLLQFTSGEITGLASTGSLSIDGTQAFVADAGATTSNSALTGLATNAGALSLADGASITTTGALANSGSIALENTSSSTATTTLNIGGSATEFGPAGVLTGDVTVGSNSLLEFADGQITGIAAKSELLLGGASAFVADAGATTSNSALTGLASNAGALELDSGASVTTTGALVDTGSIALENFQATTPTTTLDIGGSASDFGSNGLLSGEVTLSGNSLLEFATGGQITGIGGYNPSTLGTGLISIDGTQAFVADAGATTSNSALSGLASNAGSLTLDDGASITTTGAFANTGTISLANSNAVPTTTTLDLNGSATTFGEAGVLVGSVSLSGASLLEFTGGQISGISGVDFTTGLSGSLSIDGTSAFVADAGATTSNSALAGLASVAGSLTLSDGASITTTGALANTGSIDLANTLGSTTTTTLDVNGSATDFGVAGVLTGSVTLGPNSLLEFASGQITGIAGPSGLGGSSSLSIDGANAFVADAGSLGSNSALAGLASNAGSLTLENGAAIATTGALVNTFTGLIDLGSNTSATSALVIDSAAGFGDAGVVTGSVNLSGNTLLEFTQGGQLTDIEGALSIDGTNAFVADAGALGSNSALTALASNEGELSLSDGASLATPGALVNSGSINLNIAGQAVATTLTIDSAAGFGTAGAVTGNINLGDNALLVFTQGGQLNDIQGGLSIDGANAFVADAGATTSNSALTGLASIEGAFSLGDGASLTTTGGVASSGSIDLSSNAVQSALVMHSAAGLGTAGVVTGQVALQGDTLLEFVQGGQFTSIASESALSIDGTEAFVADASATTSNSALTGLASNAGALSLADGASISTTGALANTGQISLNPSSSGAGAITTLDINSTAGFGTAGILTGDVGLAGTAIIQFAQGGQIATIAADSALAITGTEAFVADAGAFTSNSALAGLADVAGALTLAAGASVTTTGPLTNSGSITLQGSVSAFVIAPTTTLTIDSPAGFGSAGIVTGDVSLSGMSLLEFTQGGELTEIAANSSLSIDGTSAFVADSSATGSNSALTGLAENDGTLDLRDGASVATSGGLDNSGGGVISLEGFSNTSTTTLDINSVAGFGTAGVLTGQVELSGNSVIEFAQGGDITSIAADGALTINGTTAFLADAGATTGNSALTELASNAGSLTLTGGVSLTTPSTLVNTGVINLGPFLNDGSVTTTSLILNSEAGFGTAGVVTGIVNVNNNSLLEFTQGGQLISIAAGAGLSINGADAFVADAGATTTNSALGGLTNNAGTFSLINGAMVTTQSGLANSGSIAVSNHGQVFPGDPLTILDLGSTAGFGTDGTVTGFVGVSSAAVIEFSGGGQLTNIASGAGLSIDGANAFVADAGTTTSNSALTGLAENDGTFTLADGASLDVTGGLANSGTINLLSLSGSHFSSSQKTSLTVDGLAGFGTTGVVTGTVNLTGNSVLEFSQGGQLTSVAAGAGLSIDGPNAFVADAGALTSSSAVDIGSNAGTLALDDGGSLTTQGDLASTGVLDIDSSSGASNSSLTLSGTLTSAGTTQIGNATLGFGTTVKAAALDVTGGTTTIFDGATVTVSSVTLANNATLELSAPATALANPISFAAGATATLQLDATAVPASGGTFGNAIDGFSHGDTIDLRGLALVPGAAVSYDSATSLLSVTSNGVTDQLTVTDPGSTAFALADDGHGGTEVFVCFASGTAIRTVHGDVPVEALVPGDVAVTASGAPRPIIWTGHRAIDCRRHPRAREVMPVRIVAHAFGENRPARDLYVSPGHSICVDALGEVLIPAVSLVNGGSVAQVDVETVTYWHVELESHDILLADNMPVESYLDMGNRSFFVEADAIALHARPDAELRTHADFCRPFHDRGAVLAAVRARLGARASVLAPMAGMQADLAHA